MSCPFCGSVANPKWSGGMSCGTIDQTRSWICVSLANEGNQIVNASEISDLKARIARLEKGLNRIAKYQDAPDIDARGEIQLGLRCGVEDRGCADRYDGADYGYSSGTERALEWASNEAKHALEAQP
jgi:hypothetical protein